MGTRAASIVKIIADAFLPKPYIKITSPSNDSKYKVGDWVDIDIETNRWDFLSGTWSDWDKYVEVWVALLKGERNPDSWEEPNDYKGRIYHAKDIPNRFTFSPESNKWSGKDAKIIAHNKKTSKWSEPIYIQVEGTAKELPWLEIAKQEIELNIETDGKNNGPKVRKYLASCNLGGGYKWCAAFVYWCFTQVGIDGKKSAAVSDWIDWGDKLDKPALGSVMVIKGDEQSHVGFVAGKTSNTEIVLLGGNQSNSVNYHAYATTNLHSYRFPENYTPNYDLPKVKIIKNDTDLEYL